MFEAGLTALLANDEGILALIGTPATRKDRTCGVFPVQLPQGSTLPALVYSIVGRQSVNSVQGTNRLVMKRTQLDCYGTHYKDAKALQEAVKKCLASFRGPLSEGTIINGVLINSELDAFSYGPFLYCAVIDFNVWTLDKE